MTPHAEREEYSLAPPSGPSYPDTVSFGNDRETLRAECYIADSSPRLQTAACGFGYLAFAGMSAQGSTTPAPHFKPRAKRVIFLFMQGGVSHVDSYDYKPRLEVDDGKTMNFDDARVLANSGMRASSQRVMKPLWKFEKHGESGRWASALFPEINRHVDDLCFINSMHTDGVAHGPATLFCIADRPRWLVPPWAPGSSTAWDRRTATCLVSCRSHHLQVTADLEITARFPSRYLPGHTPRQGRRPGERSHLSQSQQST